MPTRQRYFSDRADAGRQLAGLVPPVERPFVLALPRGGVPVGYEVARHLHAPLDVVVARKLGAPSRPELGIGAIAEGGSRVVNESLLRTLRISDEQLGAVVEREEIELARRVQRYRNGRPLPLLAGRGVVLVDDGLATGVTAEAAIGAIRGAGPERLVLAVPTAAPDTVDRLRGLVDDLVAVTVPPSFGAVGEWYDVFDQTSDAEVLDLLAAG